MFNNNFLDLQKNFNTRKASETGIKLQGRSFTCKDLRMVKITCSKDDGRVHTLAHMFSANGIPLQYIYVRRSGNARESYLLFIYHFVFTSSISISLLVCWFIYSCAIYWDVMTHIAMFLKSELCFRWHMICLVYHWYSITWEVYSIKLEDVLSYMVLIYSHLLSDISTRSPQPEVDEGVLGGVTSNILMSNWSCSQSSAGFLDCLFFGNMDDVGDYWIVGMLLPVGWAEKFN